MNNIGKKDTGLLAILTVISGKIVQLARVFGWEQPANTDNAQVVYNVGLNPAKAEYTSPVDFTATYTSNVTLILSSLGITITDASQIKYIKQINASNNIFIFENGKNGITFTEAVGVITIAGAGTPLSTGDIYEVGIDEQKKAYDATLDIAKIISQAPEWSHYTTTEHLVDEVNVAAATYRVEIISESYRGMSLQLKGSGGITFTVWASNDDTSDTSSDSGWVDVTNSIIGAASLVDDEGLYFVDTDMMPDKYMIKYVASDATNAVDVWVKKY